MSNNGPRNQPPPQTAFTEHWLRAQHALGGFVRLHVRDHNLADDIIQEVAKQATENFESYDPSRPFIAWLIGIARLRMVDVFRKQGRSPVVFSTEAVDALSQAYTEMEDEVSDQLAALRSCMDKLNDRQRRVLELRYARRQSSSQIAEQVGGNAGSIDVMTHRVRCALRQCIERHMGARR